MSDPVSAAPETAPHPSVLVSVSEKLIRVLPPAFVALLILNCLFIGVIAWVFDHNADVRNTLLTKIIESCLIPNQRN
jgi:hypothetical protein